MSRTLVVEKIAARMHERCAPPEDPTLPAPPPCTGPKAHRRDAETVVTALTGEPDA